MPAVTFVYYDDANFRGNALNRWVIHGSDAASSPLTGNERFNVNIEKP